jgi:prepilin-type N-terminal cleavage/methylation domain-containing protein
MVPDCLINGDGSALTQLKANDQRGLTLIELITVLSLIGLLVVFAFLQLRPLLAQIQLDSGARQVAADLQVARMKAIAQNRRFRVTFRSETRDYVMDKEDGSSWIRLVFHGHSSEAVAEAFVALPPSVAITAVNSGGDVIFVPRGHVDGGISITLGSLSGAGTRRIIVNLAGRVRIE